MNITISIENVLGYADAYLSYKSDLYKARVSHGFKKNDIYWGMCKGYTSYQDINDAYVWFEKAERSLYAVCEVTGLNCDALIQTSRIMEKYYETDTYQVLGVCLSEKQIEDLYLSLIPSRQGSGIYGNEYYDAAVQRLEDAKYPCIGADWYGDNDCGSEVTR